MSSSRARVWYGMLRPALTALAIAGALPAQAAYPEKPIRIVVTFAPGGASDIVARTLAEPLAKALGQPVIVENKPGAGGTIGGSEVVRSAADGYTLMLSNSTPTSIGPYALEKQPYDPVKQFSHFYMIGVAPVVIMANPKTGIASLKDIAGYSKAQGGMSFGSGGPASIGHIVGEMAKAALGATMTHVGYRGGAPMTTDLIGGQIPLGIDVITAYVPMMKTGQIKGLAVTSRERSPLMPDVPTVIELGVPQLLAENYFGVSGPAGMPADVTDKLAVALNEAMASPQILKKFEELGITPRKMTGAEFSSFVGRQAGDWSKAIASAGVRL